MGFALDADDDGTCTIGGICYAAPPDRAWEERDILRWVDRVARDAADPFYTRWSLAGLCRTDAYVGYGWWGGVADDPECWRLRLEALRVRLRASGDPRADDPCPPPVWLSREAARA